MFTVEELLQEAASAEGAQMVQLVNKDGKLNRHKLNNLIPIINSALDEIYTRFVVSNIYITLLTQAGVRDYEIDPKHVVGVSNDPYIQDEEFVSPVLSITSLADKWGRSIPLNQASKKDAKQVHNISNVTYGSNNIDLIHRKFYTPKYNVLRVPQDLEPSELVLGVKVTHKRIPLIPDDELETFDLTSLDIDLPLSYRSAIIFYIFYRLMNAKGASSIGRSMYHEGDGYYGKFLKACDALKHSDSEVGEQIDYATCYERTGFI